MLGSPTMRGASWRKKERKMGLLRQTALAVVFGVNFAGVAKADGLFVTEYGPTLAPYGYVDFCAKNAVLCASHESPAALAMSPGLLAIIGQVNNYINETITATTDQDLYGVTEFWTMPLAKGDCEDYVLLKKQSLESLGLPGSAMLITVVLDELLSGHAVLTLRTSEGDLILDNRRNDILPWNKTNYTFLKRQSSENPSIWAALMQQVDLSKKQTSASE
jgi:predicted transglutaminase-like cysteine proteinase